MTSEEYPDALPLGTPVGGYKITRVIGQGGFGITYEAVNAAGVTTRRVAIKEFFPQGHAYRVGSEIRLTRKLDQSVWLSVQRRFETEALKLVDQYDHPAIVEGENFVREHGSSFLIMDYVEGPSLAQWLRSLGKPADEAQIRRVMEPVLSAVAYLHARGEMHRDLSPHNILVRMERRGSKVFEPVLIDFGAAGAGLDLERASSVVVANQSFAPLEQLRPNVGTQGTYTDIYALGGVLYYCVAGHAPVSAEERAAALTYDEQPKDGYVAAVALPNHRAFSHTFLSGIDQALSLKARQRPQSVAELRAKLGWDDDRATLAPEPPAREMPPAPEAERQPQETPSPQEEPQEAPHEEAPEAHQEEPASDRPGDAGTAREEAGQEGTNREAHDKEGRSQDAPNQDGRGPARSDQDGRGQEGAGQEGAGQHGLDQDRSGGESPGEHARGQHEPDADAPSPDRPVADEPRQDEPSPDKPGQDKPGRDKPGSPKTPGISPDGGSSDTEPRSRIVAYLATLAVIVLLVGLGWFFPGPAPDQDALLARCEKGDVVQCVEAGLRLQRAGGDKADPARALQLFEQACDKGSARGCVLAGDQLANDPRAPINRFRATTFYMKACDLGEKGSCATAIARLKSGTGLSATDPQGRAFFTKRCNANDQPACDLLKPPAATPPPATEKPPAVPQADAQKPLGSVFGATVDPLLAACDKGDGPKCRQVAERFADGNGVTQDEKRAAALFLKACESGDDVGCLEGGDAALAANPKRALQLFIKGCELGLTRSCDRALWRIPSGVSRAARDPETNAFLDKRCKAGDQRACALNGFVPAQSTPSLATLIAACEQGDARQCYEVGQQLADGNGSAKDDARANTFFLKACDGGAAIACGRAAYQFNFGDGVPIDRARAARLYMKACQIDAKFGCEAALGLIGDRILPVSDPETQRFLQKRCAAGDQAACKLQASKPQEPKPQEPAAGADVTAPTGNAQLDPLLAACARGQWTKCNEAARLLSWGRDVPQDSKRAAALNLKACEGGDVDGCLKMGDRYYYGDGVPLDRARAIESFLKICATGDESGCAKADLLFDPDASGLVDKGRAARVFMKVCASDLKLGCQSALRLLKDGAVPLSDPVARALLADLCKQGNRDACTLQASDKPKPDAPSGNAEVNGLVASCNAGLAVNCQLAANRFLIGDDVATDEARARALFLKACDKSFMSSCAEAGILLDQGDGGPVDHAKANELLTKACNVGVALGCRGLATQFEEGWGVPVNKRRAVRLFIKACDADPQVGCDDAIRLLRRGALPFDDPDIDKFLARTCKAGRQEACWLLKG